MQKEKGLCERPNFDLVFTRVKSGSKTEMESILDLLNENKKYTAI